MQYFCWLHLVDYFWYTSAVRNFCQFSISTLRIRLACQFQLYYWSMSWRRLTKIWVLEFLDLKCLDSEVRNHPVQTTGSSCSVCKMTFRKYRSILNSIGVSDSRTGNCWGANKNAVGELSRCQDNTPPLKNISQYPLHFI